MLFETSLNGPRRHRFIAAVIGSLLAIPLSAHEGHSNTGLSREPFGVILDENGVSNPSLANRLAPRSIAGQCSGSGDDAEKVKEEALYTKKVKERGLVFRSRSSTRGFVVSTSFTVAGTDPQPLLEALSKLEGNLRLLRADLELGLIPSSKSLVPVTNPALPPEEQDELELRKQELPGRVDYLENLSGAINRLRARVLAGDSIDHLQQMLSACTSLAAVCQLDSVLAADPLLAEPAKVLDKMAEDLRRTLRARSLANVRCEPSSGGKQVCTFSTVVHGVEESEIDPMIWALIVDAAATTKVVTFTVQFFDDLETPPSYATAYIKAGCDPPESASTTSWNMVTSVGYARAPLTDRDPLSKLVNDFRPGLLFAGDDTRRLPAQARLGVAQTLGNRADADVQLSFKMGDLGEKDQTSDVVASQYKFNAYSKSGALFRYGKYTMASPAMGAAMTVKGEGLELILGARLASPSVGYLTKRESLTGVADAADSDSSALVFQIRSVPLTPLNMKWLRTLSLWAVDGNEHRQEEVTEVLSSENDTESSAQTVMETTRYDYQTVGAEVGFGGHLYNDDKVAELRSAAEREMQRKTFMECVCRDLVNLSDSLLLDHSQLRIACPTAEGLKREVGEQSRPGSAEVLAIALYDEFRLRSHLYLAGFKLPIGGEGWSAPVDHHDLEDDNVLPQAWRNVLDNLGKSPGCLDPYSLAKQHGLELSTLGLVTQASQLPSTLDMSACPKDSKEPQASTEPKESTEPKDSTGRQDLKESQDSNRLSKEKQIQASLRVECTRKVVEAFYPKKEDEEDEKDNGLRHLRVKRTEREALEGHSLWSWSASVAHFESRRTKVTVDRAEPVEAKAPEGLIDRRLPAREGRGSVSLVRGSVNQFGFLQQQGDDFPVVRPRRSFTLTYGKGSGDRPETDRDEGYLGETAGFAPDKILLASLMQGLDVTDDNLSTVANPLAGGLTNKEYFGLEYTERTWSPWQLLAPLLITNISKEEACDKDKVDNGKVDKAAKAPKCFIDSQAVRIRLHHYRLDEPAFNSHDLGWEFGVDFEAHAPLGVKTSVGAGWLLPGKALEPLTGRGSIFTVSMSLGITLK